MLSPKERRWVNAIGDQFPVLQDRRNRLIDDQKADEVRRVLWRAFQHGSLSEDEFASALDRLEFATTVLEPVLDSPSRAERGAKKVRIPHTDSRGLNVSLGAWPAVGQARVLLVLERPVLVELITLTLNHGVCTTRAVTMASEVETLVAVWQPHLVILDTDLLSTRVYGEHYYGHAPRWLEDAARERRPDLYLLLDIDLPWVPDPQRDRGHLRPEMHARFREAVEKSGTPFVLICGGGDERFTAAREAIDRLLVSADSS